MQLNKNVNFGFLDNEKGFGFAAIKGRTEFWQTKAKKSDFSSNHTPNGVNGGAVIKEGLISKPLHSFFKDLGVDYVD